LTDLTSWLLDELDDAAARLADQVLALVPPDLRAERPGGGNSIAWSTLHVARHADLALSVLTGAPPARGGGFGLDEAEPTEAPAVDPEDAAVYASTTLTAARALVADGPDLAAVPDAAGTLDRAEVPRDAYGWLFEQWSGQPVAFFIRWPLIGHVQNHVGEMIATRNRLGLSPHGRRPAGRRK
jgi:hypothetical protein